MHDTCHAHVNSVMPNDMQAEDKLEMRSRLWCQLTGLGEVGNRSLLKYLHRYSSPKIHLGQMSSQKDAAKKQQTNINLQHLGPFQTASPHAKLEDPALLLHQCQPGRLLIPRRLLSAFCPARQADVRASSALCSVMCLGQSHDVHHVTR